MYNTLTTQLAGEDTGIVEKLRCDVIHFTVTPDHNCFMSIYIWEY